MDLALMDLALLAQNNIDATPFFVGGGMLLFIVVLGILSFVLFLWALIDAIQNPALDPTSRIVWILVILLTNGLGAILYLLIGRSRRLA